MELGKIPASMSIMATAKMIEMGAEWRGRHQRLQELTGLPPMSCRDLLWAANNDVEAAVKLVHELRGEN